MKCPAMAIDAETKLADQFLYHASSEQCEKLHELGYDSSAQGILNRFDMTNTISTRPMAEHCTVPDRLDRLSQSKDSETRFMWRQSEHQPSHVGDAKRRQGRESQP